MAQGDDELRKLETPSEVDGNINWAGIWLSRYTKGKPVSLQHRPIMTGDVFFDVPVHGVGEIMNLDVIILQHPCAMRNGPDLIPQLLVAVVEQFQDPLKDNLRHRSQWERNYTLMPLPLINYGPESADENLAAFFVEPVLVRAADLDKAKRRACMMPEGVALMLQRWVHHNSRGVIPLWRYEHIIKIPYMESNAIAEWCEVRGPAIGVEAAEQEAEAWLSAPDEYGTPRRLMIDVAHVRAKFRKTMRKAAVARQEQWKAEQQEDTPSGEADPIG